MTYEGEITTSGFLVNDDPRDLYIAPTIAVVENDLVLREST